MVDRVDLGDSVGVWRSPASVAGAEPPPVRTKNEEGRGAPRGTSCPPALGEPGNTASPGRHRGQISTPAEVVRSAAAAVRARHGLEVQAALPEEPHAPLAVTEALYRIAQEALHNAAKHAAANDRARTRGGRRGARAAGERRRERLRFGAAVPRPPRAALGARARDRRRRGPGGGEHPGGRHSAPAACPGSGVVPRGRCTSLGAMAARAGRSDPGDQGGFLIAPFRSPGTASRPRRSRRPRPPRRASSPARRPTSCAA